MNIGHPGAAAKREAFWEALDEMAREPGLFTFYEFCDRARQHLPEANKPSFYNASLVLQEAQRRGWVTLERRGSRKGHYRFTDKGKQSP